MQRTGRPCMASLATLLLLLAGGVSARLQFIVQQEQGPALLAVAEKKSAPCSHHDAQSSVRGGLAESLLRPVTWLHQALGQEQGQEQQALRNHDAPAAQWLVPVHDEDAQGTAAILNRLQQLQQGQWQQGRDGQDWRDEAFEAVLKRLDLSLERQEQQQQQQQREQPYHRGQRYGHDEQYELEQRLMFGGEGAAEEEGVEARLRQLGWKGLKETVEGVSEAATEAALRGAPWEETEEAGAGAGPAGAVVGRGGEPGSSGRKGGLVQILDSLRRQQERQEEEEGQREEPRLVVVTGAPGFEDDSVLVETIEALDVITEDQLMQETAPAALHRGGTSQGDRAAVSVSDVPAQWQDRSQQQLQSGSGDVFDFGFEIEHSTRGQPGGQEGESGPRAEEGGKQTREQVEEEEEEEEEEFVRAILAEQVKREGEGAEEEQDDFFGSVLADQGFDTFDVQAYTRYLELQRQVRERVWGEGGAAVRGAVHAVRGGDQESDVQDEDDRAQVIEELHPLTWLAFADGGLAGALESGAQGGAQSEEEEEGEALPGIHPGAEWAELSNPHGDSGGYDGGYNRGGGDVHLRGVASALVGTRDWAELVSVPEEPSGSQAAEALFEDEEFEILDDDALFWQALRDDAASAPLSSAAAAGVASAAGWQLPASFFPLSSDGRVRFDARAFDGEGRPTPALVMLLVLIAAVAVVLAMFIRAWVQLCRTWRLAGHGRGGGRGGHTAIPIMLERNGRLVQGVMLIPLLDGEEAGAEADVESCPVIPFSVGSQHLMCVGGVGGGAAGGKGGAGECGQAAGYDPVLAADVFTPPHKPGK